jgi:hypothetical protein
MTHESLSAVSPATVAAFLRCRRGKPWRTGVATGLQLSTDDVTRFRWFPSLPGGWAALEPAKGFVSLLASLAPLRRTLIETRNALSSPLPADAALFGYVSSEPW